MVGKPQEKWEVSTDVWTIFGMESDRKPLCSKLCGFQTILAGEESCEQTVFELSVVQYPGESAAAGIKAGDEAKRVGLE